MKTYKANIFNKAARHYDSTFTNSNIGRLQRARVYYWLETIDFFQKTKKVFEINCGTGYDAEQFFLRGHDVIATDGSDNMVEIAQKRNPGLNVYQRNFNDISIDDNASKSEVVFSNFGGLNCLNQEELDHFLKEISKKQRQGNFFIAVFMAKGCFMEDAYHFLRLKWRRIGRRNTDKGLSVNVNGTNVMTYYHAPSEVIKSLELDYEIMLKKPIAFFLPPSYLEPFFEKRLWLLRILNNLEQLFGGWGMLSSWSDHYIIIAKKK